MDVEDARTVLRIMTTADDYCAHCASKLFIQFVKEFPEFKELATEIFMEVFGEDYD
ncbi:hypothetical protein [Geoglobus ahangari]